MNVRYDVRSRRHPWAGVLLFVLVVAALLPAGCAPEVHDRRFSALLERYPATDEQLRIRPLSASTTLPPQLRDKPVTIIVHPGYALFFREERRSTYSAAKYDLLEYQLSQEARFLAEKSRSGDPLILVLPGNYARDSIAPRSYITYLNAATIGSPSVFYILSETSHSGDIPLETTVLLYDFLRNARASVVLVGGGFIGRCEKEFHSQLTTYVENIVPYIVPEISSVSPDDISNSKAVNILEGLRRRDFQELIEFIDSKHGGSAQIRSLVRPSATGGR